MYVLPVCTSAICSLASYVYFPQAQWLQGVFFCFRSNPAHTFLSLVLCVCVSVCMRVRARARVCVCVYPTSFVCNPSFIFFLSFCTAILFFSFLSVLCPSATPSIKKNEKAVLHVRHVSGGVFTRAETSAVFPLSSTPVSYRASNRVVEYYPHCQNV